MSNKFCRKVKKDDVPKSVKETNGNSLSNKMNSKAISFEKGKADFYMILNWHNGSPEMSQHIGCFKLDLKGLLSEKYIKQDPDKSYRLIIRCLDDGQLVLQSDLSSPKIKLGEFKSSLNNDESIILISKSKNDDKSKNNWPLWSQVPSDHLKKIFLTISSHIKFINPAIVEAIADDNMKNKTFFMDILVANSINPDIYLWDGSPCVFPGVRRFVGKYEEPKTFVKPNLRGEKQALFVDGNSLPVHFWSYVLRGKKSNNQGPTGHALAHLVTHKDYNAQQISDELKLTNEIPNFGLSGLFSAAFNTAYCPTSLMKPTDFNIEIRRVLQQQLIQLYDKSCTMLPRFASFANYDDNAWQPKEFNWNPPVGDLTHISKFLDFRRKWFDQITKL